MFTIMSYEKNVEQLIKLLLKHNKIYIILKV